VPAEMKLAITLRYLATGDLFTSLMYLFRVLKQFISSMLPGVLKAIIESLQDYVKVSFLLLYFTTLQFFFTLRGNLHNSFLCTDLLSTYLNFLISKI
jgi:hypothetical protein